MRLFPRRPWPVLLLMALCAGRELAAQGPAPAPAPPPEELRLLMNLHAFTRLYGYVRFFHPSDAAATIDWNNFAIYGAERVMPARDRRELAARLEELFTPLTPGLELREGAFTPLPSPPPPAGPAALRRLAWQHLGVAGAGDNPPFRSLRAVEGGPSLFADLPPAGTTLVRELADGLFAAIPLTLWADGEGTLPHSDAAALAALQGRLAAVGKWNPAAYSHRLAPAIALWTLLQHFAPNFPELNLSWDRHLIGSFRGLREATSLAEVDEALHVHLLVLIADAAAGVSHPSLVADRAFLPLALSWVNGELVVASSEVEGVLPGDVVLEVDGMRFTRVLDVMQRRLSGSAQYRQARALELFGLGPAGSQVKLKLRRGLDELEKNAVRSARERLPPFRRGLLEPLPGGGLYLDLRQAWGERWEQELPRLAAAERLIVDLRGEVGPQAKQLLAHLVAAEAKLPAWEVAARLWPDQEKAAWRRVGPPPVAAASPRFAGRLAFLVDGHSRGAGEELLQAVEDDDLGDLVGSCSAGTGGLVQRFELPGGFLFSFTLTRVTRPGGQTFFLQGVCPREDGGGEIEPTLEGLRQGRDELLQLALERLRR